MIRFMHIFNYSEGVSREENENWYLTGHVPRVKRLPGIVRYRSWKQWDAGIPYPSPGAPAPFDQFARRSELCFADTEAGIKTVFSNSELWTPSQKDVPGFRQFECLFPEEEPAFNLLQDVPYQHYKYMMMPLAWLKGRPQVDENEEIFIDTYCIRYTPDVTWTEGEDWYLGHHTREGKQLPGIRHYKTWRVIRVPEPPAGSTFKPNKWSRLTELGMSPAAFKITMVDDETRVRFTSPPGGRPSLLSGWLNISIKLDRYDDLLK